MVAWLKEYVVKRAIPIRHLLLGFGVILVWQAKESFYCAHSLLSLTLQSGAARDEADDLALLPILKVTLTRMCVVFIPASPY